MEWSAIMKRVIIMLGILLITGCSILVVNKSYNGELIETEDKQLIKVELDSTQ